MPPRGRRYRREDPISDDSDSLSNIEFVGGSDESSNSEEPPPTQRGWIASVVVGSIGLVSSAGFKALQFTAGKLAGAPEEEGGDARDGTPSATGSSDTSSGGEEDDYDVRKSEDDSNTSSSSWGTARMYSSPGTTEVPPLSFPLRPPQMANARQDVIGLMQHRAQDNAPYGDEVPHPLDAAPIERHRTTLLEAITLYREDPSDYTGSLIQSALAGRGLDERISADELEAAGGDEALVTYIVKSGLLDAADPAVVQEIQACADETMVEMSPDAKRVNPVEVEFLRTLLEIPHVVISPKQRVLLRQSGFEFVKLLHDFPAAQEGIDRVYDKCWWTSKSRHLQTFIIFILLVGMTSNSTGIAVLVYYWYAEELKTELTAAVLAYLGCHVVSFIVVSLLQRMKAPPTVYGADSGDFPTIYLKIVPVFPLLEFYCLTSSFKHQVNRMKNIVLYHDVFAMAILSTTVHAMTQSLIMLMLGAYFLMWQDPDVQRRTASSSLASFGWLMLVSSSSAIIGVSSFMYVWIIFAHDSVNSLGFARFGNSITTSGGGMNNGSIFARLAAIILLYLFLINSLLLAITLANIGFCSKSMIVWTSVSGAAVVITLVIIVCIFYKFRNFMLAVRWTVIPLALQLAFVIYTSLNDNTETDKCRLFFIVGSVNTIVGYVGWGSLLTVCALWGLHTLYTAIVAKYHNNSTLPPVNDGDARVQRQPIG